MQDWKKNKEYNYGHMVSLQCHYTIKRRYLCLVAGASAQDLEMGVLRSGNAKELCKKHSFKWSEKGSEGTS